MMRKAEVYLHGKRAGTLTEVTKKQEYLFEYDQDYSGPPVSVTLPVDKKKFSFESFPPFFEGLLPEGVNLDMLLRRNKIDRDDLLDILFAVGNDTVGAVTVKEGGDEEMSNHI